MSKEKWVPVGVAILFGLGGVGSVLAKTPDMYPTERDSKYSSMTEYYNAIAQTLATPTPEAPKKAPVFPTEFTRSPNLSTAEMKLVSYTPDEIKNVAKDVHKVKTPSLDEVYLPTKALPYFWKFVMYQDKVVPLIWKTNMSKDDEDIEVGWVRKTDTLVLKNLGATISIYAPLKPIGIPAEDWYDSPGFADSSLAKGVRHNGDLTYLSWTSFIGKGNAFRNKRINIFFLPHRNDDVQELAIPTYTAGTSWAGQKVVKELGKDVTDLYVAFEWNGQDEETRAGIVSEVLVSEMVTFSLRDVKFDEHNPKINELLREVQVMDEQQRVIQKLFWDPYRSGVKNSIVSLGD